MNVLVTGATGFLGYRLIEHLVTLPNITTVVAAGRRLKPHATLTHAKVHYVLGDLSDEAYVDTLFESKPEVVVNSAALSSPWGAYEDFYQANVVTQEHLIAASQRHGIRRYVYISTPSMYTTGHHRLGIKESDPLPKKMVNHYAATKHMAEQRLDGSGLPHISLRPRAIIGRGDTTIMPRVLRAHQEGRMRVIGKGDIVVDFSSVANVVHAIMCAMQAPPEALGGVYNITNGEPVRLYELMRYVFDKMDLAPVTRRVPYWLAHTAAGLMEWRARQWGGGEPALTRFSVGTIGKSTTLDISLAREKLGYAPSITTHQSMDEFIAWYQTLSE